MTTPKTPTAPSHLAAMTRRWWRSVVADFQLEDHEQRLLTLAGEAWDMNVTARTSLAKDGLTFRDDRGNIRSHPAVAIARDAKTTFARMVRELRLVDVSEPSARPPALRR